MCMRASLRIQNKCKSSILDLIKRSPKVQEKNMSCERALNFDQ